MISRARFRLTGLAAMATLIAVVIGLPFVLYRFGGSPLPSHITGLHHLVSVLTSRDDGALLLGIIRDSSWLAWLLFSVAAATEVQAAMRGRAAPRLWLGGIQGGAARLVALAALTFTMPSVATLTASAAVAPVHAELHLRVRGTEAEAGTHDADSSRPGAGTDTTAASAASAAGVASAAASQLVTVHNGDCLWTIARHYLGAGDRYPEIVAMNYGHDMGDGQVFTNPSLIQPRWRLLLPASDVHDGSSPDVDGQARHLGHASHNEHFRRQHLAAGARPASSRHPAEPASQPAHQVDRLPADANADVSASSYQTSEEVAAPDGEHIPESAAFGAGALAGAVLTSLTRLRRRQRQYRRRGRRIALPADPDVLATEQRLRAAAPLEPPSTLHDALAYLESGVTGTGQVLPDIVGLHVTSGVLEVLLASPAPEAPPPPYTISPGRQGMCWQVTLASDARTPGLGAPSGRGSGLLPGLFTAGRTDDGCLLLDLESLQITGCDGPSQLVDQVVAAAATELATGQWSGWCDLVLVGFDELEVLGRAEHCPSMDAALSQLDARCQAVRRRLADQPPSDVRQLRLTAPHDEDWGLTILVSRIEPSPDQLGRLLELADDGPGGIAALVAGDPETADGRMAPTVLQLAPDPDEPAGVVANVVPLQIMVRPQVLPEADYQAVSKLFATATQLDDVSPTQAPYEMYGAPPWIPEAIIGQDVTPADGIAAPPWTGFAGLAGLADGPGRTLQRLEVRILGPFVIAGAADQLQPKQAELVLALALAAPGGLANSALCNMLGADPDHPKPSDAVRQIIARTRRRLGQTSDGRQFVLHTGNGNYVLHRDASLDWTEFRNLTATGRAEDLRTALSLVRGEPFTGSYYWWIDIPLVETVRAEIVDAAETLAEFELATGSARGAARAARAGLTAEASAEQLWRLLMRAEHAAGNLAGVAEAWRRCLDSIEDIAPDGEPHPDTAALYRQLISGTRQQAPVRS